MNTQDYPDLIPNSDCTICTGCNQLELKNFKGKFNCPNLMICLKDDKPEGYGSMYGNND